MADETEVRRGHPSFQKENGMGGKKIPTLKRWNSSRPIQKMKQFAQKNGLIRVKSSSVFEGEQTRIPYCVVTNSHKVIFKAKS